MVSLKDYVNNFPAKIVGRMTPPGTRVNKTFLKLEKSGRETADNESGQCVDYWGYRIRFGAYEDSKEIWVRIEPISKQPLDKSELEEKLSNPESFSNASKPTKRKYLNYISRGKVENATPNGSLMVKYKFQRDKMSEEIFDAFWFVFKPIIMSM